MQSFMPRASVQPTSAFQTMDVLSQAGSQSTTGRVAQGATPTSTIDVMTGKASSDIRERYKHIEHPITAVFLQLGAPAAKEGDALRRQADGKTWYIRGIEDAGQMAVMTQYVCTDEPGT